MSERVPTGTTFEIVTVNDLLRVYVQVGDEGFRDAMITITEAVYCQAKFGADLRTLADAIGLQIPPGADLVTLEKVIFTDDGDNVLTRTDVHIRPDEVVK